jgi:hypothetical protein
MTMLSPLGKVPKRSPDTRRRGRRAWPMVIFILVFAIAATVVWWRVISSDSQQGKHPSCAASSSSALSTHDVQVRVYNATSRSGLAAGVSKDLRSRGLDVIATANDPTNRKVTGVAEIRYGTAGSAEAKVVLAAIPGGTLVRDRRTDATVDIALGPRFQAVAPAAAINAAVKRLTAATASKTC